MKYLEVGTNEVVFTLKDRIKLSTPYILLLLKYTGAGSGATGYTKLMLVTDTSTSSQYHNVLNIELVTDPNDEDLPAGKVYLQKSGNYHYEVYESADTVLDINGKCLLEKGIMRWEQDLEGGIELERNSTEYVL